MATTTTTLDDLFNNIIVEAQFTAQENSIMRNLVRQYDVAGAVGNVVQVPVYGTLTLEDGAEGTALTGSDMSSTSVTISMAEKAAMTLLTDDAIETIPSQNLAADMGRVMGEQMASAYDAAAMAKFANFKAANDIDATAGLSTADLFKAAALLRAEKASGNLVGVFHPIALYNLKQAIANTGSLGALSNVGNAALESGLVGQIAGITIFESTNATTGGVFALDALGGAMKRDVRIESERDAASRASKLVGSSVFGFEAIRPEFGVNIATTNVFV